MEGLFHHRIQVVVFASLTALVTLIVIPRSALAKGKPFTDPVNVTVSTDPTEVTVEASTSGQSGGAPGVTVSGGGSDCHTEFVSNIDTVFYRSFKKQFSQNLDPYFLWCGGQMKGLIWLSPGGNGGQAASPPVDPRMIAMRIRDEMPVPGVQIASNPRRGMVGVKTWFWITGYNGLPLERTTPAFGSKIQVRAEPERYRWNFADGTVIETSSPGRPYPKHSHVTHTYQRSSAGLAEGYPVQVTFEFAVSFRVNGGPWQALPGISRSAALDFPVQEAQAVIQQ
jgi:hypothetical protein